MRYCIHGRSERQSCAACNDLDRKHQPIAAGQAREDKDVQPVALPAPAAAIALHIAEQLRAKPNYMADVERHMGINWAAIVAALNSPNAQTDAKDAERWRKARTIFSIEDIERAVRDMDGSAVSEEENAKADAAIAATPNGKERG